VPYYKALFECCDFKAEILSRNRLSFFVFDNHIAGTDFKATNLPFAFFMLYFGYACDKPKVHIVIVRRRKI